MHYKKLTFCLSLAIASFSAAASENPDSSAPHSEEGRAMDEISVVRSRESDYTIITENAQQMVEIPGALGDPLLAVFSLPGVLFDAGEGGAPAVRGSSPADNLYLVDGMPAGYIFHAFSTSIFNENIIQDFELYSAGFGAPYGDATGAVFDIRLRNPRNQPLTATVDISMLRSGVFFEGAVTENSEFYLSARNSMMQYFFKYFEDELEEEEGIRIQSAPRDRDYQFKYAWRPNDNDTLTLSANGAWDIAQAEFTDRAAAVKANPDMEGDARVDQGFDSQSLQWERKADTGSVLNTSLGHFNNRIKTFWGDDYHANIRVENTLLKSSYATPLTNSHTLSIGGEMRKHRLTYDTRQVLFVCTEFDPDCELRRGEIIEHGESVNFDTWQLYINDYWAMTETLSLDAGLHLQHNDYTGESFVHPRAALAWQFAPRWTATTSAGRYNRFPDIETVLPAFGGSPDFKSPSANHYTLGLKRELDDRWSWSLEAYYKTLHNLPLASSEPLEDSDLLYTNNVSGEAYGFDLLINKGMTDRWYGWVALSYARSSRTNEHTGETIDYYLDTPLVLNLVANYQLNQDWSAGMRFTTRSGQATTPIIGVQENPHFDDSFLPIYGEPFSERLPAYHRLDIRFKRDLSLFGYDGHFTIDVLNALNTRNVMARNLDYDRVESTDQVLIKEDISMGMFPSVGLSLTF